MMKSLPAWMGCSLLLWTTAGTAQDAKTELHQMQGTWSGAMVRVGGKEPSEEEKQLKIKLVIAGSAYKAYVDEMLLMEGTLRLDPSQRPPAIDAVFTVDPLKGTVQKGIYELKGDVFVVNFAKPGDERPRDFQTRPESEEATVRYVREKK
jgi:uncharacterized protein (TIGR03067 family)